uniref:Uncharacterized protein n=1 Tax=Fagus sylvatica TaxID=28930 RepID=A0A2N9I112_FAGSY
MAFVCRRSDLICGKRRIFRPFMRMEFHDVEEQGPPECWAGVVTVLEWWWLWWPWQISQVFSAIDYHLFALAAGIDLGGYGRFLGLFGHYFIFLVIFAAGDAAVDCFVTELAVDRWVIRRGPLGNSPWTTGWCGRPAFFLFSRLP